MKRVSVLGVLAGLVLGSSVMAATVIDVGTHSLLPDTAGQVVAIDISSNNRLTGVVMQVQTGDGGAELGGVAGSAPGITGFTKAGTVFATADLLDSVSLSQYLYLSLDIASGSVTVPAGSKFMYLTINTSGFSSGSYPLTLSEASLTYPAGEVAESVVINNGSLVIESAPVPLPLAAWGGLALFGLAGAKTWRKNRTARTA